MEVGSQLTASWSRPSQLDTRSIGTWVYDIECHPGRSAKLARAARTSAKIMKEPTPPTLSLRLVRLPSSVEKLIDSHELLKEVDL